MTPIRFDFAKIVCDNNGITVVKFKTINNHNIFADVVIDYDQHSGLYWVKGDFTHSSYFYNNAFDEEDVIKSIDKIDKKFIEIEKVKVKQKRNFFTSWFDDLPVEYKDEERIKTGYYHFDKKFWNVRKFHTNNILIKH